MVTGKPGRVSRFYGFSGILRTAQTIAEEFDDGHPYSTECVLASGEAKQKRRAEHRSIVRTRKAFREREGGGKRVILVVKAK